MVRLFYILGLSAVAAACGVFARTVEQWNRSDPELDRVAQRPGVVEAFRARQASRTPDGGEPASSPLVVQADAFARYLNPPGPTVSKESLPSKVHLGSPGLTTSAPEVRPRSTSVNFRVIAVSCYPDRPARSMALLCASGSPESEARWVKEGAGIGHFVVRETERASWSNARIAQDAYYRAQQGRTFVSQKEDCS